MICFELFGLPGAGKTTVTTPLIEYFNEKGYQVASHRNTYGKRERKIQEWLKILFSFSEYRLFFYYWMLYRKANKRDIRYLRSLVYYSHQILRTIKEDKYDIMFLEEGVIQYISSLFYLEKISDDLYVKKIASELLKKIKIIPILCSVDIEESMKRVKERSTQQNSRYSHSVGTSLLRNVLYCRQYNLNVISSFFSPIVVIDMNKPIIENVRTLINLLTESSN